MFGFSPLDSNPLAAAAICGDMVVSVAGVSAYSVVVGSAWGTCNE